MQGIDTAGKDGATKEAFRFTSPLGVHVHAFGKPTEEDLAHDYLWRLHKRTPRRGYIGVFNRSQYEDVLVVKVRKLAPPEAIEQRYEQINQFEKHLAENGTRVLKLMLHISKEQQGERLRQRLEVPEKRWKFNPSRPGRPQAVARVPGSVRDGAAALLDAMGAVVRRAVGQPVSPRRNHREADPRRARRDEAGVSGSRVSAGAVLDRLSAAPNKPFIEYSYRISIIRVLTFGQYFRLRGRT